MKKRLLKPPAGHGEVLFIPGREAFSQSLKRGSRLCTCHQLGFFHPGIAVRFHLVDLIERADKRIIFMDTDRTALRVRIPWFGERARVFELLVSDRPLYTFSSLKTEQVQVYFDEIMRYLHTHGIDDSHACIQNLKRFVHILLDQTPTLSLRERLADGFATYSGLTTNQLFLSDLLTSEAYSDFLFHIYGESERFRLVYNESIDAFSEQFRFRFKNYPFPRLRDGELPFWIIRDHKRHQLNTHSMDRSDMSSYTVIPKASPLTLFLRRYMTDIFLHGVGGANYEWINDRIFEEFYHEKPSPFFTMSATFHLLSIQERDYPFFFIDPDRVRNAVRAHLGGVGSSVIS
jgi:hypothetical protein